MKSHSIATCLAGLAISNLCSSCSLVGLHTGRQLREKSTQLYQRGLREGAAREVRKSFHEKQRERERPEPPPKIEYYPIPVPAHISEDGVKIEAHTVTIPIIKN